MREGIKMTLRLGLMMLIAGLLLSVSDAITKEPIEQVRQSASMLLRAEVLSGATTLPIEIPDAPASLVAAYRAEDGSGYVFEMLGTGFSGAVEVTVGIRSDGTIEAVRVGDHQETPGLGDKAEQEPFYGQFSGQSASKLTITKLSPADGEIQAITAATITSRAVTYAVNDAIDCYHIIAD